MPHFPPSRTGVLLTSQGVFKELNDLTYARYLKPCLVYKYLILVFLYVEHIAGSIVGIHILEKCFLNYF